MKLILSLLMPAGLLTAQATLPFTSNDNTFLLKGATVHTMSGAPIENGSVLVRNGKIIGVGKNLTAPKDVKVIDLKGMQVYPGMIDAATDMGLSEVGAVDMTVDTTELGRFNPELVAVDAVNPESEHLPITRANGVTTSASLPQGQLITGQASLIHMAGWTTDELGLKPRAGLTLMFPSLGGGGRGGFVPDADPGGGGGGGLSGYALQKQNYDKAIKELDGYFEAARRYKQAKDAKAPGLKPDLKLEAMIPVLEGKEPILVTARREREIKDAIAWADKQKVKIVLVDAVEALKAAKEIKDHNIAVILGPTNSLPEGPDHAYDEAFTTPLELQKAGIKFALATLYREGPSFARNLPYQAAQAVAFGLPPEEAMLSITKNAAEILGVGDQIGSVDEGKWADLLVTDGNPMETKTTVKMLFIKGKPVDLDNKQKDLYDKYLNRPATDAKEQKQ